MIRKILKRITDPRNLLTFIVLIIAILGVFGIPQEQLGFTDNDIILGLLVFLLVEQFIVSTSYLTDISERLRLVEVREKSLDKLFSVRNEREKLDEIISQATWIRLSGISLDTVLGNFEDSLHGLIQRGYELEVMISDPDAPFLDYLSPSAIYTGDKNKRDIGILINLMSKLKETGKNKVRLKKSLTVPYFSSIHAKLRDGSEYFVIEFYVYKVRAGTRKGLELQRRTSPEMFAYFEESEQNRWDESIDVEM